MFGNTRIPLYNFRFEAPHRSTSDCGQCCRHRGPCEPWNEEQVSSQQMLVTAGQTSNRYWSLLVKPARRLVACWVGGDDALFKPTRLACLSEKCCSVRSAGHWACLSEKCCSVRSAGHWACLSEKCWVSRTLGLLVGEVLVFRSAGH